MTHIVLSTLYTVYFIKVIDAIISITDIKKETRLTECIIQYNCKCQEGI